MTCDLNVEVLSLATDSTKVFALPSGELSFESWATPQWTKRNGSWVKIDTNLVVGDDGLVRPVASLADVAFSPGGDGPFARMSGAGAEFSLAWPEPLPAGVIDGDTITYREVLPGVDLVVRAERGGFSHLLVVKTPEAARNPAVRDAKYLVGGDATVVESQGSVVVSGPEGLLAAAPPAVAWDSRAPQPAGTATKGGLFAGDAPSTPVGGVRASTRGPGDDSRRANLHVRVDRREMTISVDPALLTSADFPLFIDPTYDQASARWIPVNNSNPNTQWTSGTGWPRETARVGSNWDVYSDIWRAHFEFDTTALRGRRITGTPSVDAYLVHTGWCAGTNIEIWQTHSITGRTPTWNGMSGSWLHGGALQTKLGKANENCWPTGSQQNNWMKFDASGIGSHLQQNADLNEPRITFGFKVPSEGGGNWAKFDPANVRLKATYQYKPTSPVAVRTDPGGSCATTSPGPWINDQTPTLYGKASDDDGTVKIEFDVDGPTSPANHVSDWTSSGVERGWTTPTLADGNYNWRVRGTDTVDTTAWTGYCYFRVDHVGPTTPQVQRTSGTPVEGQPVTLKFTSSDSLSGVKQFAYGIGVDAKEKFVSSTGTATISFTPEAGRTVVYVWAGDNAGNWSSSRAAFNVYTGRITDAQPQGAWRLDGDGLDDSGQGHDLTPTSGVGFGPDRKGHANSAMTFDGTGCAETAPVIRTDAEFTVAGWAKLNDKDTSAFHTLAVQAGTVRPSFYLHYSTTADQWRLSLTNADTQTVTWASVSAPSPTPVGVWQHVAATVDPVAKVMRLYLGGVLAAEKEIPFALWDAQSRFMIGCAGSATGTWDRSRATFDNVGVWQGLLSDAQIARAATELPAGLIGEWKLRGNGVDSSGFGRDFAVPEGVTWVEDEFGRSESAAHLDGSQCLDTGTPVVRADESFTIAAWVKLDTPDVPQTILLQAGALRSRFKLVRSGDNKWYLTMAATDTDVTTWFSAGSLQNAKVGAWQHLVGVYDATAAEVRLYVDGALQQVTAAPHTPWNSISALQLGCGGGSVNLSGAVSDAKVWRGVLTPAQVAAEYGGNPPVALQALWPLDGPESDEPTLLSDVSGNGHDLTVNGTYSWVRDRGFGRDGALGLELANDSCAQTAGPVVATNESFTVTAWVLLEEISGHHTVLTQVGTYRGAFYLKYEPGADRWKFEMTSGNTSSVTWHTAQSLQPPELGVWTHLAGVYDVAAGKVRLYVNGVLQDESDGPANPWLATGPTLIGCAGKLDGTRWDPLGGVVDDVRIWTSTLDPDRIADLAAG